jgi:hypothetical protein
MNPRRPPERNAPQENLRPRGPGTLFPAADFRRELLNLERHFKALADDLQQKANSLEAQAANLARLEAEKGELETRNRALDNKLTYARNEMAANVEYTRVRSEQEKRLGQLEREIQDNRRKALLSACEAHADVRLFASSFLGLDLVEYPDSDTFVLSRQDPEFANYDLDGPVDTFTKSRPAWKCTVDRKGWKDKEGNVWVAGRIRPVEPLPAATS